MTHCLGNLREFACELTSSWPPVRVEGRVWAALLGKDPANPLNPLNPVSVPECVFWSNTPTLFADFVKSDTPVQCLFDFFLDLPAKTPTFESVFGRLPARNALKVGVLAAGP